MKTLRLILWRDCFRSCEDCVNKTLPPQPEFDWDFTGYDEIVLTGGEPLLYFKRLLATIMEARRQTDVPIYVYTAIPCAERISSLLPLVEGITLTVHDQEYYRGVLEVTERILLEGLTNKSLRLNSFVDIPVTEDIERVWQFSRREFIKDCPIPEHEVVMEV